MSSYFTFTQAFDALTASFRLRGAKVATETWQSLDVRNRRDMETYELLNETISVPFRHSSLKKFQAEIKPNLPWADDHFYERVSGTPVNPPPSEAWWPHAKDNSRFKDVNGKFSHTYPERYWPKEANSPTSPNFGIRYPYGDLGDIINLLQREPNTRQAYFPVFFPEDTGAVAKQRIPCSLGYHFIRRSSKLHIVYYLRSCDFANHFRDDVYLTIRLLMWVHDQLCAQDPDNWSSVTLGTFTMHITSLHLFVNDYIRLIGSPP